jgi:hypothetical protein
LLLDEHVSGWLTEVGNKDQMEKELKFWTKACQMKALATPLFYGRFVGVS